MESGKTLYHSAFMAASSPLDPSPAASAIGFAGLVVLVSLLGYVVTTALGDWPALMLATLGAMLGASFATTRLVAHDLDWRPPQPLPSGWSPRLFGLSLVEPSAQRMTRRALHAVILLLALSAQAAAWLEEPRLLVITLGLSGLWYLLFRAVVDLASPPDPAEPPPPGGPSEAPDSVFPGLFQAAASLLVIVLIALGIAADTDRLWSPARWDDFQGLLLLVLLEAVSAPVAAVAGRR
jgi:hypothetical protein